MLTFGVFASKLKPSKTIGGIPVSEIYIVNCCRTAIGSFGGSLKDVPATEMGAIVAKEALKRAGVKPEQVSEVMFGCILTAGQGQNVARQVAVKAGIPYSVPAYTVGMVCGSGMKSVIEGARAIKAGDAEIVLCGGTENMSAAPYAVPTGRYGARMGNTQMVDTMIKDGLWEAYNNYHMGTTAENINDVWGITREEQDAFAAASQQKTEAAQKAGKFEAEIVPVPVKKKKEIVEFKVDEYPKAGVTAESIAKLRGAFPVGPEGVEDEIVHTFELTGVHEADTKKHVQRVTAANASGINDGAAAIVLASAEAVEKYGLKPMAKLIGYGQGGVDPKIMGVGPVPASRNAMAAAGVTIDDIDLVEANEAFAAQSIAVARELGFDMSKVNVNGGAISLGHPVGASGARIIVTLLHEMQRRDDAKKGLATLCIGGGMGTAVVVEKC
ncbi:MAG TPA: acetyl-CoA C-acetyltransferase [Firmicutes bacterium]|nr:acetyl-CoA C-acetyltransferase [Bacillota bacterium]